MREVFDMCVDYEVLCNIEVHLKRIISDLSNSNQNMIRAIRDSKEFLSGYQFEKAKSITEACVALSTKTGKNIKHGIDFLGNIKEILEEYGDCVYCGEQL